jgi:eukaryotic-like serine/threonine-protein kinase
MLGRILDGRYRIVRALGSGGFGHTYVAEDTKRPGNPLCALKHLSFSSHDTAILQQVRRMFFAEAATLENLGQHDRIPQLLAYFEENGEFYLVQEFIRGHALSEELTEVKTETWVTEFLEEVLPTLGFIHSEHVIHRDIKPENIIRRERDRKLVLIDFGAVKNIENSINEENSASLSIPVYTSGYAASEQCLGKPKYNSDIYSLGVIAIQALTGVRPSQLTQDPDTGELVWRDRVAIRADLANVLELMTKFNFGQRYQTAEQVLETLEWLKDTSSYTQAPLSKPLSKIDAFRTSVTEPKPVQKPWKRMVAIAASGAVAIGASTWAVTHFTPSSNQLLEESPTPSPVQLSFGSTILTPGPIQPPKQEAVDYLSRGEFTQAATLLEKARKTNSADPETLIYLNNAKIGKNKAHTIAVVVPLATQPNSSKEVLRGVSQAQHRVNQTGGIQGVPLKVAIANDSSDVDIAREVAKILVKDESILGVVGHGTSSTTLAAGEVYKAGQLVSISPVSSATQISDFSPYMFRTMPSDQAPAKRLGDYLATGLKKRKAVIFYNAGSKYSESLRQAFKDSLYFAGKGAQVIDEVDLSMPDFDSEEKLNTLIQKGAEVLMLAPDDRGVDRTLSIIQANRKRLPILGGDTLYSSRILRNARDMAVGLTIAIPSYQLELDASPFNQQAKGIWGQKVNWRSALAFDATQALIAAIQQSPTRNGIRSMLARPDFTIPGSLRAFSFLKSGDRQAEIALMRVSPTRSDYEFKPIK